MSATSAAGLSRNQVFEHAAALPSRVAHFFERVETIVRSLHYDYPTACRRIGEGIKLVEVKSFFLRFADALQSGEPMTVFLAREARAQGEVYSNEYERNLESLKKWTDAYSSIIISEALIVIINLVSTMIYDMGTALMAVLVTVAVMMGFFGAWVLTRSGPQEVMTVSPPEGSAEQRRARKLLPIMLPVALIAGLLLVSIGVEWQWVLLSCGVLFAPVGIISYISDKKVSHKELEIGPFLRSLGGMATSTGTTLTEALGRIDLKSFPALASDVTRLGMRLRARLKPRLCWWKFGADTGSMLISQAIGIFHGAVDLGGDPEEVSSLTSMFTTQTALLRAKRRVVTGTFSWLVLAMHGALTGLLILVLQITFEFRSMVQSVLDPNLAAQAMASVNMPILDMDSGQVRMLNQMTIGMVLLLNLINAFAIIGTDGGFKLKVFYFLSILMVISAVSFFAGPPLVKMFM